VRLILVRHGQTPSNVIGSLDTAVPGPGLTELGHRQAAGVPSRLNAERIDRLYVSTLIRTHLTAGPLAAERGLVPIEHGDLRELSAGDLEGRTDAEAVTEFFRVLHEWQQGNLSVAVPGGENGTDLLDRFDSAVQEIARAGDGTAVVVSHGGIIRLWAAARATAGTPVDPLGLHLDNTGTVVLNGRPGNWTCESWQGRSVLDLP